MENDLMKVSVLIPTYNRGEGYLQDAIHSFLDQDYEDMECIITDDGSTDNTKEIVFDYMLKDGRIKYHYQDNAGIGASLKMGVEKSTGDLLCLIADDDMLYGEKSISNRVRLFTKGVECVFTSVIGVNQYGDRIEDYRIGKVDLQSIWKYDSINTLGIMWRKSLVSKIGSFNPDLKSNEDWDLKIRLVGMSKFKCVDMVTAKYRLHPKNRSKKNKSSGLRDQTEKLLKQVLKKEHPRIYGKL